MKEPGATITRIEPVLRASILFGTLDDTLLEQLARASHRRSLTRGEHLWNAGDRATHFHIIASGLIKIVRPSEEGDIVAILGPRESLGDSAVLGRDKYPADAIVASDTAHVIAVRAEDVLALSDRPDMSTALRAALLDHTDVLQRKIRIMTAGSVPKRLAALFTSLAERFGDECDDGGTLVPVALSRSELAHLVGATVETTIRTVSAWQKAGLLVTNANGFVLYGDLAASEGEKSGA